MTGEEMERAIEFLIRSQATAVARQDRVDQQITEMSRQLQIYAETQSQFIEIATRSIEGLAAAQARTDQRIAETDRRIAETDRRIAEANQKIAEISARTDERIAETNARLAAVRDRGAETDARLDRIAALVERNITGGNGNS